MNKNSKICQFIQDNEDWELQLENKKIKVKHEDNSALCIFNYAVDADFSDAIVQEARGIIIDIERLEVVAWPFRKFGNSHEFYADSIDWNSAKVEEKVDGSIIKLWWSEREAKWVWATNSCIRANEAKVPSGKTFVKLIHETHEYNVIQELANNERLDKDCTYMFELVGPENQVVLRYDNPMLYHIGTRNKVTGQEFDIDIGIQKPQRYPLKSLDECIAAAKALNKSDFPTNEGFVVVDKDYHRIKIKSPEYLIWHHQINNGILKADTTYELLKSDDFDEDSFKENVSDFIYDRYEFYKDEITKILTDIRTIIDSTRRQQQSGMSRKDIAISIKDNPYKAFAFSGLDNLDADFDAIITKGSAAMKKLLKDLDIQYNQI